MPLIEGLGDEVTVVLGVLFIIFIVLIAWLSTRTTELPFFSVIVVELSARAARLATGQENGGAAQVGEESSEGESANSEDSTPEAGDEDAQVAESVGGGGEKVRGAGEWPSQTETSQAGDAPGLDPTSSASSASASAACGSVPVPCFPAETSSAVSPSDSREATAGVDGSRETTDVTLEQTLGSEGDQNVVRKEASKNLTVGEDPTCEGKLDDSAVDGEIGDGSDVSDLVRLRTNSNEVRRRRLEFLQSRTPAGFPQTGPAPHSVASQPAGTSPHQPSSKGGAEPQLAEPRSTKSGGPATVGSLGSALDRSTNSPSEHSLEQEQAGLDSTPEEIQEDVDSGLIRVRLKFLNDTNRLVRANPSDTVGHFRREHFAEELAENKLVRFIFNGRALQNDAHTLQACNIQDNSVVHCLVTRGSSAEGGAVPRASLEEEVQLGSFIYWLFALVLGLLWYARVSYCHYFNPASTLMLGAITFIFLLAYAASFCSQHRHQHLD